MKQNMKFFTIVISLLIISAIMLTGCMHGIARDNGEMKAYAPGGQTNDGTGGNILEEDAPLAQTEMQVKFNAYLHKEGNTVTVFSEEQYAQFKSFRDNGERTPLTYEEILFIVNDSINMYFTYDEIRLTNANKDNIVPVLTNQSGNTRIIRPDYKSSSEYDNYDEAQQAYEKMLVEIYEIIYYRIYMHDAGFETVHHMYHSNKDNIFGNRYMEDLGMISSAVPVGHYQILAIDGATFSGIENEEKLVGEYKTLLEWEWMYQNDNVIDYPEYPTLNAPVLMTQLWNPERQPMEYKFYIVGPKAGQPQQIFPTAELEGMMPHKEFYYEAVVPDDELQPCFSLNFENRKVTMSAANVMSFVMLGDFELHDDVLKMYFGSNGGTYSYVFYKHKNDYVYSKENSTPVTTGGFDFADGLVFEEVYIGVSTNPGDNSSDNTEEDGTGEDETSNRNNNMDSKNEMEMPYFKIDYDGMMCYLMSSDGCDYANGPYIIEGDALVLYFDMGYQYTFYYNEDVGYVYCKGESNPFQGYEIEDETIFTLVYEYVLMVDTDKN
ncbi:MAG: hypothetical protein ACI4TK_02710 [Agathobacter sp.]